MSYHEHPEEIAARRSMFVWPDLADRFNVCPAVRVIASNPEMEIATPSRITAGSKPNYRVPPSEKPVKKRGRAKVLEPQPPSPRQQMAIDHAESGLTAPQIAVLMGNTTGTIKEFLKHGRQRQRAMQGAGPRAAAGKDEVSKD